MWVRSPVCGQPWSLALGYEQLRLWLALANLVGRFGGKSSEAARVNSTGDVCLILGKLRASAVVGPGWVDMRRGCGGVSWVIWMPRSVGG